MKKVYSTQKKVNAFSISLFIILFLSTSVIKAQTIYYSKSTGNLDLVGTWGLNTDGTGTSPANFNGTNRIYVIANRTTATIGAAWNITASSKIQVGNGSTAVKFTIPSNFPTSDIIDVTSTATLTIQNLTIPIIGALSSGSTVEYGLLGNQTIRNASYYNLILSGSGRKSLSNTINTSISNNLIINNGVQFRLNTSNTLSCTISGSVSGTGTIRGSINANLSITGNGSLGTLTFAGNLNLYQLTVNRTSSGSLTLGSNLTVTNAFTHTNGILNLNGKLFTLNNAITFPSNVTNGSFTGSSTSSLSIAGTGAITNSLLMNQTSSATKSMNSIILNRTGTTLTIGNPLDIINNITPTAGTVGSAGNITLKATSAGVVGRIGIIGAGASVTGNVTAESFASGGTTGWTLLGSAGITGRTFTDWNDDFSITCLSCPNGSVVAGVPFTSLSSYNETAGGTYSNTARYVDVTSISTAITPAKGYWVYLGNSTTTSSNIIFDVTGPVNQGNKTINLSYTSSGGGTTADWGYNLISNPYPSPISWSSLRNGNTSVANAIYVYNPDLGNYASYAGGVSNPAVGSGGIGNMIPAGQGFYVKASAATSLTALETNKATSTQVLLKSSQTQTFQSPPPLIRIKANGAGMHNETAIYFDSNTHAYYETEYDAVSLGADYGLLDIVSVINDTLYSINGMGPLTNNTSIPIKITTGTTGSYQIYSDDFQSLPSGACLILHDNLTNTDHNLRSGPYTCSISNSETATRFTLNITVNNNINVISNFTSPSCSKFNDGYIIANASISGMYNYYWKDSANQIIKTVLNKSTADTLTNLSNGYYSVDIANTGACSNGTQSFQLQTQNNTTSLFSPSTINTVLINDSAIVNFNNNSNNADSYWWDFGDGNESTDSNPFNIYTNSGEFPVLMQAINSTCGDTTSYEVTITITNTTTATGITENTTTDYANTILIEKDKNGYYTFFAFKESSSAIISVWNILGEKICNDIFVPYTSTNKVYIPIEASDNGLLIITVTSNNGAKAYRKIINN